MEQPRIRPGRTGFGVTAGLAHEILEPLAHEVAALGYGSFWVNDSGRPGADGLDDLAFLADVEPGLELGVGVMPLDRRSPDAIASDVARLDLPLDRTWLGVGSGAAAGPLGVVRDGVAGLRRLLPGARIMVGALGPRMCELTGEVADGVLLNWATPARIDWARARIGEGATRAGRGARAVEVCAYVRAAVGPEARGRLGAEAARYATFPAYGVAMRSMGVAMADVGVAGDDLAAALVPYQDALDRLVVRALPARTELREFVQIARAAAAINEGRAQT